jgi:hypothetical protein
VHGLIERAKQHVVLVTAYLDMWPSLELVIRDAVDRGVAVHLVIRSKDETHFERHEGRRLKSIERARALHVTLHEVDWLHTKLYLNESEAIIGSLNLTANGRDGPNLCVHLQGAEAADQALQKINEWIPEFSSNLHPPRIASAGIHSPGYCIRCQGSRPLFNPTKPYCCECWQQRKAEPSTKSEICCHCCGKHAATTLQQPLCAQCANAPV